MSEIMLSRNGSMKWTAKCGKEEFIGNNPEDAIGKLLGEHPEQTSNEIKYQLFKPKANCCCGKKSNVDLGKCPNCGLPVVYARNKKENGRMGVSVFHEGEVPEGAELNPAVKEEYKRWLLKDFHQTVQTETSNAQVGLIPETEQKTAQEPKIIAKAKIEKAKIEEVAKVLKDRKIVNIDGMKHNRFAIVGEVMKSLRDGGTPEEDIKTIRNDMMTNGNDFNSLVGVASQHVILYENGMPVQVTSGI